MVGFIIPIINVLAVSVLIWFSGEQYSLKQKGSVTVKAVILNPLILACVSGMIFSRADLSLPVFIDNTLHLFSILALPLALISIGGQLTLIGLKINLNFSIVAACFKLIMLPVIGYLFLNFFAVTGIPYKVGLIFFSLPTSTATYVLSSQLSSDTHLATSAIVLSTILSFFTLSLALML